MRILVLALILSFKILNSSLAFAGYTITLRPQITPATVLVYGVGKMVSAPNPGPQPVYPATVTARICSAKNLYSAAAADRTEVWADSAGTAADADVLAACPNLRAEVIGQIKSIRKQALAQLTIDSGVSAVYSENYVAAVAHKSGQGAATVMKDGQTASVYLSGFGAQLGMSAGQFADYIIAENRRIGPTAYQVEQEYLRLAYSVIPLEPSVSKLLAYPDDYRRFCGL